MNKGEKANAPVAAGKQATVNSNGLKPMPTASEITAQRDIKVELNPATVDCLPQDNFDLVIQNEENQKLIATLQLANKQLRKSEKDIRQLNTQLAHKVIKRTTQYAFITQINQSIAQTDNAEALFYKSCQIARKTGRFKIAWIGLFDHATQKINIASHSGIASEDIFRFKNATYQQQGPQHEVLTTGTYALCNNIPLMPDMEKFKSFAERNSISSFMVLPIKRLGSIIGTFNLYSSEIDFFDKEEIALMVEVAGDISFALDLFEKDRKHKATEHLIIQNEKRFRALVENGADAVAILSLTEEITYISPSIKSILGYTEKEAFNLTIANLLHPDDALSMAAVWTNVLQTRGIPIKGHTVRMRHKDGTWRMLEVTLTNMLHDPAINGIIDNFRDVTHIVNAERQREFDRDNLNALINSTDDLMWSVDTNFNLITFNHAFSKSIGTLVNQELAIGSPIFWDGLGKAQKDRFQTFYNRAFAGETFTETEYTADPIESWAQISYYPIRSGAEIIGSACYSRDITSLKKAEDYLKRGETFNRGVLDALNAHIAVVDGNGTIVAVNDAWTRFTLANSLRDTQSTGVGSNYFRECERAGISGNDFAGLALQAMKDVMDENRADVYLEYPCHAPKENRWFGMSVRKFDSEDLIVVAHNDITERKSAQENLMHSQNRLKEAQALAHMGSWQLNFETNILQLSDESCRIFGRCNDENQLAFAAWSKFIHRDDRAYVLKTIKESRDNTADTSYIYRIVRENGAIRHIYSESKFMLDEHQTPIGLHGIMQDVTERKMAEQEREKITADIIRRNKDLEQFSYIVSHNLRAPVANILGLSEIVRDENLEPEVKNQVIAGISDSVRKLDEVITDLNYILQTRQNVAQEHELVDFQKLVTDIMTSIETLITEEKAVINTDFSQVSEMLTVKSYLHSIFYNLIYNSLKYRKPDIASIISLSSRKNARKIFLIFEDNGIGIDLLDKGEQVFGMYKRFHPQIAEGKGMGLYMVKTQVEAIGGKIYVESQVDKGTVFTIEFPL